MNMYVGNLSFDVKDEELRAAFEAFGQVVSATVIKDKYSGESRGFGFVEMSSKDETQAAIDGLNGKELKGRTLNVGEARPRDLRSPARGRPVDLPRGGPVAGPARRWFAQVEAPAGRGGAADRSHTRRHLT